MIGHLVGAQRPTVSLALHALAEAGLLRRGDTGAWTLGHNALATLAADSARGFGHRPTPCPRPLARDAPPVIVGPGRDVR